MSTIGMMDGAFFVGRKEIMDWINSTLDLNLSKVEDTANGAVACQLLDIMYPGQVPMHKVNWAAKQNFEFVANYKILQGCFDKLRIEKFVDVDRLISGRYMDNLEFMQWFKRFFEMSVADKRDYDAVGQRAKGKGGATYGGGSAASKRPSNIKPSSAPSAIAKPAAAAAAPAKAAPAATSKPAAAATKHDEPGHAAHKTSPSHAAPAAATAAPVAAQNSEEVEALRQEVARLKYANEETNKAYSDLKGEMEGLEKERDFYFEKLRDVEVLLQELEDKGEGNELTGSILKILYATAEGFEQVTEAPEETAHEDTY